MSPHKRAACLFALVLLTSCARKAAYSEVHAALPAVPASRGEKVLLNVKTPTGERTFTLSQLEALRAVEYRVRQPQLKKAYTYRGVLLSDLARETGLAGRDLRFDAINDYGATVQASDYMKYPVLLAYLADGQPISIAAKGPLTVVFPTRAYPNRFPDFEYGPQWVWYVNKVRPR